MYMSAYLLACLRRTKHPDDGHLKRGLLLSVITDLGQPGVEGEKFGLIVVDAVKPDAEKFHDGQQNGRLKEQSVRLIILSDLGRPQV